MVSTILLQSTLWVFLLMQLATAQGSKKNLEYKTHGHGLPCRLVSILNFPLNHIFVQSLPFAVWDAPALKELNLAFNLLTELPVGVEELPLPTPPPGMATSEVHVMLDLLDKFMY